MLYVEVCPVTYKGVRDVDPLVVKSDESSHGAGNGSAQHDPLAAHEMLKQDSGNTTSILPSSGPLMRELAGIQSTEVEAQIRRFDAADFVQFWLREQDSRANEELRKSKAMREQRQLADPKKGTASALILSRAESIADKTDPARAEDADEAARRMKPIMCDQLVNPMRAVAGSSVARLFDSFVRVQRAGDILFWSKGDADRPVFIPCETPVSGQGSDSESDSGLDGQGYSR